MIVDGKAMEVHEGKTRIVASMGPSMIVDGKFILGLDLLC